MTIASGPTIVVTMPCDRCGESFSCRFDATSGRWRGNNNPFDEPEKTCRCARQAVDAFDIADVDASVERIAQVAEHHAALVRDTLADTMRIAFAHSVPSQQQRLELT